VRLSGSVSGFHVIVTSINKQLTFNSQIEIDNYDLDKTPISTVVRT